MALNPVSTGDPHVTAHNDERTKLNNLETEQAKRILMPLNPKVGDLLRFDGTNWVSSKTRLFEGSGTPEGKIAAPMGSRYVDTNNPSGAVEYIKRTGADTSNTGWVVNDNADTGLRELKNLAATRGTATIHTVQIRRVGSVVDLYIDLKMPNNTSAPYTLLNLPVGFRPMASRFGALQDNKELASNGTLIGDGGDVNFYGLVAGKQDRYNATYLTRDAFPTSLPGSAL